MFFKLYFVALPTFFAIDMTWLGFVAKNFYQRELGHLISPNVNWVAAILFYLLFIAGLVTFVIEPSIEKRSWMHALMSGGFFGLVTYATYDLTNLATVKNWSLSVTFVDLAWGVVLGSLVSLITYTVAAKL